MTEKTRRPNGRVLVVGAGPVGLMTAAFLRRQNVDFDLVDARGGPIDDSRALGLHARTLEFMAMLGLDDAFVKSGQVTRWMTFHRDGRPTFSLDFAALSGMTPYPFYLIVPQPRTEEILRDHLAEHGVRPRWNTRLVGLVPRDEDVLVRFDTSEGEFEVAYDRVVAADGARSTVREALGVAFQGATYPASLLLAEVEVPGDHIARDATHVHLGGGTTVAVIPLPNGTFRVVGPDFGAPPSADATSGRSDITFEEMRAFLDRHGILRGVPMENPSRLIAYRMHKRVAERFRVGRVFLAGDAAHIHSPAGGQGMNTGMHDAVNIAWKLGMVLNGHAPETLLDTYETERRTFARQVVAGTDAALSRVVSKAPLDRLLLDWIAPLATRLHQPRGLIAGMAQIDAHYGDTSPSADHAGGRAFAPGARFYDAGAVDAPAWTALGRDRPVMFLSGSAADTAALEETIDRGGASTRRFDVRRLRAPIRVGRRTAPFVGGVLCRPDGYVVTSIAATAAASDLGKVLVSVLEPERSRHAAN